MKKSKGQFIQALLEGLLEIVIAVACFALGALVLHLFGGEFSLAETDVELIILIGVLAFFAILLVVCTVVNCIKRVIKRKRNSNQLTEEQK